MAKPLPEGVSDRIKTESGYREGKLPAKRWHEASDDFVFFTPGPLYTYMPLESDPLADILEEAPKEAYIVSQPFKNPVFRGLSALYKKGPLTWNHVLCAVPREYWQAILLGLAGVRCISKVEFYSACVHAVQLPDPTSLEPVKLQVLVFSVNTTNMSWEPELYGGLVQMVRRPAKSAVVIHGAAMLEGDIDAMLKLETDPMRAATERYKAFITQRSAK